MQKGTPGRGAPFFLPAKPKESFEHMEKINWSALPLLDLSGRRADVLELFDERVLLVFLRHLA